MAAPVAIFGAGQLGRQVHHHLVAHLSDQFKVIGFVDDSRPAGEAIVGGLSTLGGLDEAPALQGRAGDRPQLVFAIGYGDMRARRRALDRVLTAGHRLCTLIHPRAHVEPGAVLGDGCILLAGVVVDQQVRVGRACFLDVGVRLTNATRIGANNYLATGVSTGSRVSIGDDCFVGMDSTVVTDVTVGRHVFVNAKSLIARDLPDDTRWVEVRKAREWPQDAAETEAAASQRDGSS